MSFFSVESVQNLYVMKFQDQENANSAEKVRSLTTKPKRHTTFFLFPDPVGSLTLRVQYFNPKLTYNNPSSVYVKLRRNPQLRILHMIPISIC